MEEVLEIIRSRLSTDPSSPERAPLQVEDVMELLDICLKTTYFQLEDKFHQKKIGYDNGKLTISDGQLYIYGILGGNKIGYSRPQNRSDKSIIL
jgi:hypothetical protein